MFDGGTARMPKHAGVEARNQALALKLVGMSWAEIRQRTGMRLDTPTLIHTDQ